MKPLAFIHTETARSAVGDFAPVTSIFSHHELGNTVSPFLLLDHIGPGTLKPIAKFLNIYYTGRHGIFKRF